MCPVMVTAFVVVCAILLSGDSGVSVSDLLRAVADRESVISDASYHVTLRARTYDEGGAELGGADYDVTVVADGAGRYRLEGTKTDLRADPRLGRVLTKIVQTFDGSIQKGASGTDALTHGWIASGATPSSLPVEPREFTTNFQWKRVSEFLRESRRLSAGDPLIVGRADFEGRPTLVVETATVEAGGQSWKQQFHIDAEHGFSVVRKASLFRDTDSDEWMANYVCELTEPIEVAPTIWLPQHGVTRLYQKFDGKPRYLESEVDARIDGWLLNTGVSDTTFEFAFPPNVFVTDKQTGKSYLTGLVSDPLLAAQTADARRLASRRFGSVTVLLVAVLVAIVALSVIRVRAGRAKGPVSNG